MTEREKVIRGLEACNRQSYNGSDCQNCPYYDDEDTAELPFGICNIQDMFDDALALLRDQEPVKPIGGYGYFICGVCKNPLNSASKKFCSECGKAVKWDA